MEIEQIIRLIETVSASGLTEFEYSEGEVKLVLKAASPVYVGTTAAQPSLIAGEVPSVSNQVTGTDAQPDLINNDEVIKSPLVGTFYSAPSEDSEEFVSVGDTVKKGQVLGLIETMKLMNEVECDRDGIITAILIENEQVVEYGQPLFAIR